MFRPAVRVELGTLALIEPQDLARAVGPDRDLADHAETLDELRAEHRIPPLLPADAAVGDEVVVAHNVDPYAN